MTVESAKKEYKQFLEKKTFQGVPTNETIGPKRIVTIKDFAKAKRDADGNMTSLKTRGVGRGDHQDETIYEKRSSPTAST